MCYKLVINIFFCSLWKRTGGGLYGQSLQKHELRYIPFVGDRDSKSYAEARKMALHGEAVFIPKEDCIKHVTKRMGTALRKLQATDKGMQFVNFITVFNAPVICILLQSIDCKTTTTTTPPVIKVKKLSLNMFVKGSALQNRAH